jgi:inhibitor of KinA
LKQKKVESLTINAFSEKALLIKLHLPGADDFLLLLSQWAKQHLPSPPVDIVPAGNNLMLIFNRPEDLLYALQLPWQQVLAKLESLSEWPSHCVNIPLCFNAPYTTDLHRLADFAGCSLYEVKQMFLQATFKVRFIGFLPGFPYLEGVPSQLAIPRKASPERVEAGAVAIAGSQAGIYPVASPGGWHVVGYTPMVLFNPHQHSPCMLQPGFTVRFKEVSASELEQYSNAQNAQVYV